MLALLRSVTMEEQQGEQRLEPCDIQAADHCVSIGQPELPR
ncbi:MAG: hypothetical protein ACT4QE_03185 [Anaerolineales bacterium]